MPLTVEEQKELTALEDVYGQSEPILAEIPDTAGTELVSTDIPAAEMEQINRRKNLTEDEQLELKKLEAEYYPDKPYLPPREYQGPVDEFVRSVASGSLNVGSGLLAQFADVSQASIFDTAQIDELAEKAREISRRPEFQPGKDGGVAGFIANSVGQALPFMAGTIAATLVGGPAAGFSVAYAVEGKNAYFDAIEAGATQEEAEIEAFVVGSINAALEHLQVERVLKFAKAGKGSIRHLARAAKLKSMKRAIVAGKRLGKEALKTAITEGIQEALQESVSVLAPALNKRELPTLEEAGKRIGQSALGGAVAGPFLGGGGAIVQALANGKTTYSRKDFKDQGIEGKHTAEERQERFDEDKAKLEAAQKAEVVEPAPIVEETEIAELPAAQEQETATEPIGKIEQLENQMQDLLQQSETEKNVDTLGELADQMDDLDSRIEVLKSLKEQPLESYKLPKLHRIAKKLGIKVKKGASKSRLISKIKGQFIEREAGKLGLKATVLSDGTYRINVPEGNATKARDFATEEEAFQFIQEYQPATAEVVEPAAAVEQEEITPEAEDMDINAELDALEAEEAKSQTSPTLIEKKPPKPKMPPVKKKSKARNVTFSKMEAPEQQRVFNLAHIDGYEGGKAEFAREFGETTFDIRTGKPVEVKPTVVKKKAAKPREEKIVGLKPMAQRLVNAENEFIDFAKDRAGLTQEQAETVLVRYQKEKLVKLDPIGGNFTLTDGRFAEPDVLRKAAEKKATKPKKARRKGVNTKAIGEINKDIEANEAYKASKEAKEKTGTLLKLHRGDKYLIGPDEWGEVQSAIDGNTFLERIFKKGTRDSDNFKIDDWATENYIRESDSQEDIESFGGMKLPGSESTSDVDLFIEAIEASEELRKGGKKANQAILEHALDNGHPDAVKLEWLARKRDLQRQELNAEELEYAETEFWKEAEGEYNVDIGTEETDTADVEEADDYITEEEAIQARDDFLSPEEGPEVEESEQTQTDMLGEKIKTPAEKAEEGVERNMFGEVIEKPKVEEVMPEAVQEADEIKPELGDRVKAIIKKDYADHKRNKNKYKKVNDLLELHWPNAFFNNKADIMPELTRAFNDAKIGDHFDYGSQNKIVTKEQNDKDRKDITGGPLNIGINPALFVKLVRSGTYHAEAIARQLGQWSSAVHRLWKAKMVETFGKRIEPHLDKIWAAVEPKVKSVVPKQKKQAPVPARKKPVTKKVKKKTVPKKTKKKTAVKKPKPTKSGSVESKSVIADQMKATLANQGIELGITYDPISIEEETEKAISLTNTNIAEAERIAYSEVKEDNLLNNAVRLAYFSKMIELKNWVEAAKIANWIRAENTRLGQEIVVNKGFITENSPMKYVKQLVAAKMDAAGKRFGRGKKGSGVKKTTERLKTEVAAVKEKMTAAQMNIKNAQDFIESLKC